MLFPACSRSQLNFFTNHQNNPMEYIFIFFSDERSVGVKTMRKRVLVHSPSVRLPLTRSFGRLLGILEEKNIQRGIIVFPGNMTPSARKVRAFGNLK